MRAITEETRAAILTEQFIPDHVFLVVVRGQIRFYDTHKTYTIQAGECCFVRKNRLVRFIRSGGEDELEPILFCFDHSFLQTFQKKYNYTRVTGVKAEDTVVKIARPALLDNYLQSIKPYYRGVMALDALFEELKYEELLLILLQSQPALSDFLFDFERPQRVDLEAFMNRSFRFNVGLHQLAYLTGRSLSAFKRDFKTTFNDTPSHWLVKKRLQEAYFLIDTGRQKPSNFYLDLGFESLSHFSVAFRKEFSLSPSELARRSHS